MTYFGIYRGLVDDNKDPEMLGRLLLKVPEVYGESIHEYWAFPMGLFAGKGKGFYAIPDIGDGVWVQFEKGNARFPVWTYGWWASGEMPEKAKRKEPTNHVFQTKAGQRIELDDEKGEIILTNTSGLIIKMKDDKFFLGKGQMNMGKLIGKLFSAFANTKVATQLGAQPFINAIEYQSLKTEFEQLFLDAP